MSAAAQAVQLLPGRRRGEPGAGRPKELLLGDPSSTASSAFHVAGIAASHAGGGSQVRPAVGCDAVPRAQFLLKASPPRSRPRPPRAHAPRPRLAGRDSSLCGGGFARGRVRARGGARSRWRLGRHRPRPPGALDARRRLPALPRRRRGGRQLVYHLAAAAGRAQPARSPQEALLGGQRPRGRLR